jgi:hypothetical protein
MHIGHEDSEPEEVINDPIIEFAAIFAYLLNIEPLPMLHRILSILTLVGLATAGHAQTVATFTVAQPPQFVVDAGDDLAYTPGLALQVAATGGSNNYSYLWAPAEYLDDPTSPTPVVQGIMGGTLFTVQVTDLGIGCTLADDVQVDFTTGMPGVGDGALAVFPNPSDGMVRIHAPVALQRVQLRSLNGALAMEYSGMAMRELVMDVSALPAGLYFMSIEFVDGSQHTHKLCATTGR